MTPWGSRFETGHPLIDAEHKEIFRKLDAIESAIEVGAGREVIVELIGTLQKYALQHFSREEEHMLEVRCPAYGENCVAHRVFEKKFNGWIHLLCTSGSSVTLVQDIRRETSTWIEGHIVNIDCRLRACPRHPAVPGKMTSA